MIAKSRTARSKGSFRGTVREFRLRSSIVAWYSYSLVTRKTSSTEVTFWAARMQPSSSMVSMPSSRARLQIDLGIHTVGSKLGTRMRSLTATTASVSSGKRRRRFGVRILGEHSEGQGSRIIGLVRFLDLIFRIHSDGNCINSFGRSSSCGICIKGLFSI